MRYRIALVLALLLATVPLARATTLAPEMKAYDFAQAYYIEDGGVVIVPYTHGFFTKDGIQTPEGIRIMPGGMFLQIDGTRRIVDQYRLLRLNKEGTRAYFREHSYRYTTGKDASGKSHMVLGRLVNTDDFYLTKFRALEWFDFAIPSTEIHPGYQSWRTRPQY